MCEKVVILGDSVTIGAGFSGVDRKTCFVSLLGRELEHAGIDVRVTPSALDGVDTQYALRRFDRMVSQLEPDILVISLGLNDARPAGGGPRCNPDRFTRNLTSIVERTLEIDTRPILTTPSPRLDMDRGPGLRQSMKPYAARARHIASAYDLPLIELYDEFVSHRDLDRLIPDRLHPGPAGHRLIARQFARTLLPIFRWGFHNPGPVSDSPSAESCAHQLTLQCVAG